MIHEEKAGKIICEMISRVSQEDAEMMEGAFHADKILHNVANVAAISILLDLLRNLGYEVEAKTELMEDGLPVMYHSRISVPELGLKIRREMSAKKKESTVSDLLDRILRG